MSIAFKAFTENLIIGNEKNPTEQVKGRQDRGGTSQVKGVQLELKNNLVMLKM